MCDSGFSTSSTDNFYMIYNICNRSIYIKKNFRVRRVYKMDCHIRHPVTLKKAVYRSKLTKRIFSLRKFWSLSYYIISLNWLRFTERFNYRPDLCRSISP